MPQLLSHRKRRQQCRSKGKKQTENEPKDPSSPDGRGVAWQGQRELKLTGAVFGSVDAVGLDGVVGQRDGDL
jgi:hypothetical protein